MLMAERKDSLRKARERRRRMSVEDNKTLARRSWEVTDNLDLLDEVYAADFVWHEPDQDIQGSEEARQFINMYKSAFPDLRVTVEDVLAEGDQAVTRWTIRGTHRGDLMGTAPTERKIEFKGISIHRIEGGKIVEEWNGYDTLGVMQQIGAVPSPEQN
jgi:steroid delta-isomerase-like uncharacterized protein